MPRIATSLVKRAKSAHPFLPLLLRATRDLDLARNELRWLAEYQRQLKPMAPEKAHWRRPKNLKPPTLRELCVERSRGRPLQYILGTQPFCDLEILCRKGVFIPRSTTEGAVVRLINTLLSYNEGRKRSGIKPTRITLNIVEPCTGTGCNSLALYAKLQTVYDVNVIGIDISKEAVQLARRNLKHNISKGLLPENASEHIQFRHGDIMNPEFRASLLRESGPFHIAVLNPPYLSEKELRKVTERSVRLFEPRTALLGSSEEFQEATSSLLHPQKGGIMLCEYVDLEKALLQASRLMENSFRRYVLKPRSRWSELSHRDTSLNVHVWRDKTKNGAKKTLKQRFKAAIQGEEGGRLDLKLFADHNGPCHSIVVGYGSYASWLYGISGTSDLDRRTDSVSIADAAAPIAIIAKERRTERRAAEGELRTTGLAESQDSVIESQDSTTTMANDLTASVCEALDSVQELSALVQQQQEVQNKLVEEQAALWDELKNISQHVKR